METSVFLAQFLGIYLIFLSITAFINKRNICIVLENFLETPSLVFFSGWVILTVGILILVAHPIFTWDWRGLITLLGASFLVKGSIQLYSEKLTRKIVEHAQIKKNYIIILFITLFVGVFLLMKGLSIL